LRSRARRRQRRAAAGREGGARARGMPKKRRRTSCALAAEVDASAGEAVVSDRTSVAGVAVGTVVVGTYDGGLLGFRVEDGSQTFGFAAHIGCVKALHCSRTGRLASGGTDQIVRLFDLDRAIEVGELQEHEHAISCLNFWGTTTLVTGGEDGQVCLWRCGDWELLFKFRAHKVAVACLVVHPSGRLMASGGRDRSLRLWDLMRGTAAAHLVIDHVPEVLDWSPTGKHLAVMSMQGLIGVDAKSGETATFKDPGPAGAAALTAAAFVGDGAVVLGDAGGALRALRLGGVGNGSGSGRLNLVEMCRLPEVEGDTPASPSAGRGRVKALVCGRIDTAGAVFAAGMSSGRVEVWRFLGAAAATGPTAAAFERLQVVETGERLTCLTLWLRTLPGGSACARAEKPGCGGPRQRVRRRRRLGRKREEEEEEEEAGQKE